MQKFGKYLLPQPQRLEELASSYPQGTSFLILSRCQCPIITEHLFDLSADLSQQGFSSLFSNETLGISNKIMLDFAIDTQLQAQEYLISLSPTGGRIRAGAEPGLFYAIVCLRQWLSIHHYYKKNDLTHFNLEANPDFKVRGLSFDVSRGKIPTLKTLFHLVDLMAYFNLNQLQLYMENAFAYQGHEVIWQSWGALTGDQIQKLKRYCQQHFIELVPNQNSFGHFHKWLVHPSYNHMAECPDGVAHPFSKDKEPFSLCPLDGEVLYLLDDLYGQLLPHFDSNLFNTGLDETLDLGMGRSKQRCEQNGNEEVYLEFLNKIYNLTQKHGKTMMFWADIIIKRPDLVPKLPKNVIALEWGYEEDHPFAAHSQILSDSRVPFYVCPGTSSWQSFAGRVDNAVNNLALAAREGIKNGASGYLICDWGDFGHFQPLPVSYPGLIAGAQFAWNAQTETKSLPLENLLNLHLFSDQTERTGKLLIALGNAYQVATEKSNNGSLLFFLIRFANESLDFPRLQGLDRNHLEQLRQQCPQWLEELKQARPTAKNTSFVIEELNWLIHLILWICDLGIARLKYPPKIEHIPLSQRNQLKMRLEPLLSQHHRCRQRRFQIESINDVLQLFRDIPL